MPPDMRAFKQRSREVASRSTSAIRGQLAQHDIKINRRELQPGEHGYVEGNSSQKQSWGQWVGAKVASTIGQGGDSQLGTDEITMFPGWAVRRYVQPSGNDVESSNAAFSCEVFVSGYASNHRGPEASTRSQRAFMRLAKGFAALPKLQADGVTEEQASDDRPPYISRSTEDLLSSKGIKLPPRPTEITPEYEDQQIKELEKQFQHLGDEDESTLSASPYMSFRASSSSSLAESSQDGELPSPASYGGSYIGAAAANMSEDLRKMHRNLETRLRPFWSTALSGRLVHLSLFAPSAAPSTPSSTHHSKGQGPLAQTTVTTASDGSFQAMFHVSWEAICTHPTALHIAFGNPMQEYPLLVAIQLAPRPTASGHAQCREVRQTVPLTYSPVRVVSDIDDTVKMSGIVSGARAVFRNVFVKEMRDLVIPGMGDWYNEMWRRGVRFHYVSNGPFELIPVLSEFLEVSALPPGSIRLKSYAGRSLFNGLLSAPATRKRQGILDVLDNFPESHFVLIGDSGEQDLELYAALARERPGQIAAVFIRDVTAEDGGEGVRDPTGCELPSRDGLGARGLAGDPGLAQAAVVGLSAPVRMGSTGDPLLPPNPPYASTERPSAKRTVSEIASGLKHKRAVSKLSIESTSSGVGTPGGGYFTSSPSSSRRNSFEAGAPPLEYMTEEERKAFMLQSRIYRARAQMPNHITLRIFRKPEECVEASRLLDRLLVAR